jgi:hypothetical protein
MGAERFLSRRQIPAMPSRRMWAWAILETVVGAVLLWRIARALPLRADLLRGWLGMLGLILLLHFGSFQLLSLFWRSVGIDAKTHRVGAAPLHVPE